VLATGCVPSYAPVRADDDFSMGVLRANIAESTGAAQRARSFVVCGGGATGIDVASELRLEYPSASVTLVHRGPMLLSNPLYGLNYSVAVRMKAKAQLEARGISVLCETEVLGRPEAADGGGGSGSGSGSSGSGAALSPLRFIGGSIVVGEMVLQLRKCGLGGSAGLLRCDFLTYATGPLPATRWLRQSQSLPDASFGPQGRLRVDDAYRLRGTGGEVFALGDVCDSLDPKTAA